MDIHPPHGPVQSLREFGTHIAIVTIGILIALGLEALIETAHDHTLVAEARANFQAELSGDLDHSQRELERAKQNNQALAQLVADLPALFAHNPGDIAQRLAKIRGSGYFFPAEAWQTALSTGAMAHMPTEEIERYADTYYLLHFYPDLQRNNGTAEDSAKAFFLSHSPLRPADYPQAAERIVLFARNASTLEQGCTEMNGEIESTLKQIPGRH